MRRFLRSVLPAFFLAISVGQIYAFTIFSDPIARAIAATPEEAAALRASVQFAFSLGIFFLGMGAAFFGRIVERNIRVATIIGTSLFLGGLYTTALGISLKSLALIYLGYGFLVGTGTGIIYISPVKTMMLWFPKAKALAASLPIISFGLGSSLCTILYKGFSLSMFEQTYSFAGIGGIFPITESFIAFAVVYACMMIPMAFFLKKPQSEVQVVNNNTYTAVDVFRYVNIIFNNRFVRMWIFMFLNISCGLCLIPLAKQLMADIPSYTQSFVVGVLLVMGLMNGAGRFVFAWWSDRLRIRNNILLIILGISSVAMVMPILFPQTLAWALILIPACYGAGFSVLPAILSDMFGMKDISKIHGLVLSAWGVAGLVGNQAALPVFSSWGAVGVCLLVASGYLLNIWNIVALNQTLAKDRN